MRHEDQVRILRELLSQIDEKRNVDAGYQVRNPISAYTDRELAAKEWEYFFTNHPQLVGTSDDLPETGSFFTTDDFGVPVLATRDNAGRFRAFVNACRHRGVRVTEGARGTSRHFVCPFHNWSYNSAGELLALPREKDFGAVDRARHGLVQLPCEERYGLLFVHPKPGGALDVDALLGDLAPEIEHWDVGKRKYAGETTIDMKLNWKLANDTFGETYHFSRLHKNTLGKLFYGDAVAYETFGRNHRFVFATRGIDRLRERPEAQWTLRGSANVLYYLFPNIQLNVEANQIGLIRIYPDPENPGRSITRVSHYFSEEALAKLETREGTIIDPGNVYEPEARDGNATFGFEATVEVFDSTIEQEDYRVGESTQRSAESGALDHLIFGRNEAALHHYHNTFRAALEMPPLDVIE